MEMRLFILFFAVFFGFVFWPVGTWAESRDSLQTLIEEKVAELNVIQEEREKLEENLEEAGRLKSSLKREIGSINYSINQLDLSVRSSRISIEKLGLEIGSLKEGIGDIEDSIDGKKETIGRFLFELYQREKDDFLVVFLRNKTLADSVSEVQSIMTLNNDLTVNVRELQDFQTELILKAANVEVKKRDEEVEKANLENRQYIVEGKRRAKNELLAQTKNQEKVYEERIQELEEQQQAISEVMEEIEHKLRQTFDPTLLPLKRSGVLGYPVQSPFITQKYGNTKFAQRAYKTRTHTGTDFRARVGTPIFASGDGKVAAVDNNDRGATRWRRYQYGKYVMIEHDNNLSTLYAHLSRTVVGEGSEVRRGDLIGYSGNTGYSTAAHLHFGVYWSPSIQMKKIPPAAGRVPVGITIDPQDYL